jgi:hypothetical protein
MIHTARSSRCCFGMLPLRDAAARAITALVTMCVLASTTALAQVQYDALTTHALRRVNPSYTGNLV